MTPFAMLSKYNWPRNTEKETWSPCLDRPVLGQGGGGWGTASKDRTCSTKTAGTGTSSANIEAKRQRQRFCGTGGQ